FSLDDPQNMQTDTMSVHAQRIVKLVRGMRADVASGDARLAQALQMLRAWDGNESRDSTPAAIFEVWFSKHLRNAVLRQALGDAGAKLAEPGDATRVIMLLEEPGKWMTPE